MMRSVEPLAPSPAVNQLISLIRHASVAPAIMKDSRKAEPVLEAAARVLAADPPNVRARFERRHDSRSLVVRSIDHADAAPTYRPTMGELCRVAGASESRLRQAFVDVLDMPPTKYFQYRLLNRLRNELLLAHPTRSSITGIASSLGITEFGRTAGRYNAAFGELPRTTLRRQSRLH